MQTCRGLGARLAGKLAAENGRVDRLGAACVRRGLRRARSEPHRTDVGGRKTPEYMEAPYEAVTLPGVSHWIPTEAPEALAEHILKRIDSVT